MLRIFLKFRNHWSKEKLIASRIEKGVAHEIATEIETVDPPKVSKKAKADKEARARTILEDNKFFDSSLTELRKLIGHDKQQQVDFIDPFIAELDNYKISIKQDLSDHKIDNVRRAFHSLKTNCKIFGSFELSAVCAEMEEYTKEKKIEIISHKLDGFLDLLLRFRTLLSETSEELSKEL